MQSARESESFLIFSALFYKSRQCHLPASRLSHMPVSSICTKRRGLNVYDFLYNKEKKKEGDTMESILIPLPQDVKTILEELEAAGYSAYVVGGCVRDAVMGKTPHDFDICTSALPEQMKAVFKHRSVIETGLKHGTLTVAGNDDHYEITTYRIDGEYEDCRHPSEVKFTDRIEDDLARRDFTVNAMAYHEKRGIFDPFGGMQDIEHKIIRAVGDPNQRFTEDALRILRGVRFASVCAFQVEENTKKAMFRHQNLLKNVSEERKREEFCKLLVPATVEILREYRDIFTEFIPEIKPTFDFDQQNYHHQYDIYEHIIHAVAAAPKDLTVRLALLFHDIGKPSVFSIDEDGVGHFYGHAEISEKMAKNILKRLKFDNFTIKIISELVKAHDFRPADSEKYARKLLSRYGEEQVMRLITLSKCDLLAQAPYKNRKNNQKMLDILQKNIEKAIFDKNCFQIKDLAVNGDDIMASGVKKGKKVGEILQKLLEIVLETPEKNEKAILLMLVREMLEKGDF